MKRSPGNRWTDEQMLHLLRLEAQRIGRTPTMRDLQSPERACPYCSSYVKRFGNLGNAQRAAGLAPNDKGTGRRLWSRASAIAQLRRQARELGRTPFYAEVAVDRHVLQRLFGNIGEALSSAGLRRRRRGGFAAHLSPGELAKRERFIEIAEHWNIDSSGIAR